MEKELLAYLETRCKGRKNAITSPFLEAVLGVGGATLRAHINTLRCAGHPVCSDENGYYYAETLIELQGTIRQLQSRIGKIAQAKSGLIRATELFSDNEQLKIPQGGDAY